MSRSKFSLPSHLRCRCLQGAELVHTPVGTYFTLASPRSPRLAFAAAPPPTVAVSVAPLVEPPRRV
eukprot:6490332-Pyramimonas_sp.AAC.1